jgi:tRNA-Thr(GGU) m(6)t(6)A37 methyltransferase TsaA
MLIFAFLFGTGCSEVTELEETATRLDSSVIQLRPIGVVHSPYTQASGTAVQPRVATSAQGTVEVFDEYREGLAGLASFERIWLVCWFHRAAEPRLRLIPHWEDTERGLFATRAPSRPNPIGISPVRLIRVDGNVLTVAELDILDGTPLLDIKPYSPRFDCFTSSESGSVGTAGGRRRLDDERLESANPQTKKLVSPGPRE